MALATTLLALTYACLGDDPERVGDGKNAPTEAGTTTPPSSDAAPRSDADAGAAPSGGARFANGDFELGCLGWPHTSALPSTDDTGRSGKACRLCVGTEGSSSYYIEQRLAQVLQPGERWVARFWVKAVPNKAIDPASLTITTYRADGTTLDYGVSGAILPKVEDWTELGALVPITLEGGTQVVVVVGGDSPSVRPPDEACLLIDDATFERVP